ncbi:hypothetical protein A7Q01_01030 [Eikenella sp. NML96-A-049]|uniref:FkbM family methyltransferase n=1 Tax=Eikenella exigua TaxID=2528037 RepID=A0AAX1F6B7_9NEIS|nr:FkbM family methyltransferase [Eikenella sp. NML03-A-027]OAM27267.1 hypothetical protein A7P94_06815 [Eikenella sp. NML01-A-086]OAM42252.1 hypothetical protein A7Q01_01030 [Eikenella sp. NML96-A-049]OAM43199.1 hypothetical protein A7Q02_00470 [Eikenella sp. NML97-A-109]QED91647.1 FkbM family methyltransferase [Eikenella exigua]VDG99369.1 putative SAM-dependent methyltransferase [Helicobacter pametensis]
MKHIHRPLPFVLTSTNTGTMIVNHQDYAYDQQGNCYGVGYQYLSQGSFDPSEIELVLNLLNLRKNYHGEGVVALDCGANIGAHTIAWGIEMTGWGNVISFEAQERIYYALAGNIALNNCFNVKAIHAALGNTKILPDPSTHFLDIPVPDYTKHASFGSLELRPSDHNEFIGQQIDYQKHTQKVPLLSIDTLDLSRIDLIKMDVEGMEIEVLNGATDSIKKNRPVMLVEILKSGGDKIVDFFQSLGYTFFTKDINLLAIHKSDPILDHLKVGHSEYRLLSKRLWQKKEHSEALHYYAIYLKQRINKDNELTDVHLFHPDVDKPNF